MLASRPPGWVDRAPVPRKGAARLPDARLHRPVPDRRRLRRGSVRDRDRRRSRADMKRPNQLHGEGEETGEGGWVKVQAKKKTSLVIGAMLVVAALATAFWVILLGPKRDEAEKDWAGGSNPGILACPAPLRSGNRVAGPSLFSSDYNLVLLGKAVPGDDETASAARALNRIAAESACR